MSNQEIIERITKENILHDIIQNIGYTETKINLQDLEQDLYLELLEREDDLIQNLYTHNQLKYYLTRIVLNNIRSKNSRYFYKYKKEDLMNSQIYEKAEE